jgi:hypothetical protein
LAAANEKSLYISPSLLGIGLKDIVYDGNSP